MDSRIGEEEKLYRKVIRNPNYWKNEEGRPTSALFKDSGGVSVDRDGQRECETIVSSFLTRFGRENTKAVVYVHASYCMDIDTYLAYDPVVDNEFHALILDSPTNVELPSKKAKKLARNCHIVHQD